jgi:hypothetical protein
MIVTLVITVMIFVMELVGMILPAILGLMIMSICRESRNRSV